MTFRVGGHWGTTIVREGAGEPDDQGRRPGDELVAVVVNGDRGLAAAIVDALNARQPEAETARCCCSEPPEHCFLCCPTMRAKGYCG